MEDRDESLEISTRKRLSKGVSGWLLYRKVEQGKALIVTRPGNVRVSFTPTLVMPMVNKVEVMDISLKTIEIDRRGSEGLICRDNIRADIKVAFFVRVNKTPEDVIKVAQSIGCVRASDRRTLEELFSAKFSEALKTVGKQLDFVDLYTKREEFRDQIIRVIGRDLNGYFLEDAAIDYLEQTPMKALDEHNILDAQGIKKITELTTKEHILTNDFQRIEEKSIKKQDVEAREAILELERQQADAEAKQAREIASVRAREKAETEKVQAEERQKAELARIAADEQIAVNEENKQRQVEVAQKNRERVVAVENERVEKARVLEAISRERETEIQRIEKDKQIEGEKKLIADIVRERVAVERTVAEEEEHIKEVRVVEEASRRKKAVVIAAEAEAEEKLVKDIKAAEAANEAAQFKAKEILTLANAQMEAADKEAKGKIRLAEGIKAHEAALGLAEVTVKEADAGATEKHGTAEAKVIEQKGLAEAAAVKEKLTAEAAGLHEKAMAMHELDQAGRGHEEFRLKLEKDLKVAIEDIDARRKVAEAQALVLGEALKTAKIDIVGGESLFFDKMVKAITMGKSIDGFVDRSETTRALLADYLSGEANLPEDLKEILTRPAVGSKDVQNLTISAFLGHLITQSDGEGKGKLEKLLKAAKDMKIADLEV